jgi:phosphate transport system substrate-binding protein
MPAFYGLPQYQIEEIFKMKRLQTILCAAVLGASMAASAANQQINGAGATFPYPLYSKWFAEYQKLEPDTQINYQSIGSGGGIRQFTDKTVDFGASDAPMTDEQLKKITSPVLHIPTVLGAVVITYNVPEAGEKLQLSSEAVADIFLGKIKKWNDPQLAKLNPGVKLPDVAILPTHRSDGSGTTNIFTDYLAKVSPEWKSKIGTGTSVNWPGGLGGKGNEGVSGLVKQTPGAIGYVELIFAESNKISVATLKNKSGAFIVPSPKSVTAAAEGALKDMPADFRVSITDSAGKAAYPISGFTYLLVSQDMKAAGPKGKTMVKFLKWAVTDGQKMAEPLAYAPLPKSLVKKVEAKIASIQTE